ncbi:hypothetical protein Aperf_G00000081158 [Anoplocephala perfoliata]
MAVIQDKASCFPPLVLLDSLNLPYPKSIKILDACAAPGNKTTLLLSGLKDLSQQSRVIALDRDKRRFNQLCRNLTELHDGILIVNDDVKNPGAPSDIICDARLCDFLSIDPNIDESFSDVTAILIDPTCTGSGLHCKCPELVVETTDHSDAGQAERVARLANLQAKVLRHALSFPSVQVVVYSTCSVYQEENEGVILDVINSGAARNFELLSIWKKRKMNEEGSRLAPSSRFTPQARWKSRGCIEGVEEETSRMMARCLRSSAERELTIGFFVACFKQQTESNDIDENEPPKKKQKLTRMERYRQRKEERRDRRKAMKQRRRERRDAAEVTGKVPSPAPRRHRTLMADSTCRTRVVLDCSYDNLMSFKDICKLAHQLSNCYSTNRNLPAPVQFYITGLGSAFKSTEPTTDTAKRGSPNENSTLARLNIVDAKNWDVHLKMEDYTDLFPASSIVYLCAESPYELPDKFESTKTSGENAVPVFTADDVYVIGGFVDHNHYNGLCYEQAQKRGFRTARLPLERAGVSVEGRRVLSLLHVFQALAFVLSSAQPDWSSALRVALPPRKTHLLPKCGGAAPNSQSKSDETVSQ